MANDAVTQDRLTAEQYRARTAVVRRHAETVTDPELRQHLLNLAQQYEQLADHAEERSGAPS